MVPPLSVKLDANTDVSSDPNGEDINTAFVKDNDDAVDSQGMAINVQPAYDALINAELMLPLDGIYKPAVVTGRTMNSTGNVTGTYNENPVMNTMTYDVMFNDGAVKEYSANVIAENLLSQVDGEGFTLTSIKEITNHRVDLLRAVDRSNMWVIGHNGRKRMRQTTAGYWLLVRLHDDSEQWMPLSVLKESNPVEVAYYAKARDLDKEPAFAWWVPYTLRKSKAIIAAVTSRLRKTTHKYGVEIPRSLRHAMEIDKRNGNDIWAKAFQKEMRNVGVAFEILAEGQRAPVGWRKVTGHLIFDVRMTLERKARWVLDGHLTGVVEDISTYAGVVSRESVRILLTYAALNGLDVWSGDIRNAYTQAPSSQKDFVICGPEFGTENEGKVALIRRALYGGKTAGRDYRNHLRECMEHIGFKCCPADPDVWMRESAKSNGTEYWEYVLLYTDDVLAISEKGEHIIRNEIGKYFEFKPESIKPPDQYLGGKLRQVQLENGVFAWAYGSSQYVQAAVKNVEQYLAIHNLSLPLRAKTPLPTTYRPEHDVTPALDPKEAGHYQSLIGILRWIVELGRCDINCEVSMMSSHLALPRQGHLDRLYHIFAFLKSHHNAEVVYDPSVPIIDESLFDRKDWSTSEMSGIPQGEELPPNAPRPRGIGFIMRAYVDADHASETVTRKSRTGFVVFLNNSPIHTVSKKQTGVETSSFGSEFTAMKHCTEYLRGLRYKLRMMGIPVEGHAYVFGDNKSVLYNVSIPDSILKKKSQSLSYHFVREGSARDEWRIAYINTHENPADLMTKPLPDGEKRRGFVRMLLHHIYDYETSL
jgi:Reverse transcriptase (RNA-dependent DNA polymerase)